MRTSTTNRAALAVILAGAQTFTLGCLDPRIDLVFGPAGATPTCDHGGGGAGGAPDGGGGEGGAGAFGGDGGAAGGGGEGGTTTSSSTSSSTTTTTTTTGDACQVAACAANPAECGSAIFDCDSDGTPELYVCGTCAWPGACGGSGVPQQCGQKCLSQWSAQCASAGLPSAYTAPATGCVDSYKFVNGAELFCSGCVSEQLCEPLTVDGVDVLCCPGV